jgi:hypothetical protein
MYETMSCEGVPNGTYPGILHKISTGGNGGNQIERQVIFNSSYIALTLFHLRRASPLALKSQSALEDLHVGLAYRTEFHARVGWRWPPKTAPSARVPSVQQTPIHQFSRPWPIWSRRNPFHVR